MEVCIIGAGFSGIASGKKCLDLSLTPVIFEKSSRKGGIWNCLPSNIGAWDSMHTNTFKDFMSFSDMPWPSTHEDYPKRDEVYEYLCLYTAKHGLDQYIHLNSQVLRVEKNGEDYLVRWEESGNFHEKIFKFVVVASGKYSEEINPFPNAESFQGIIVAGGKYRDPQVFQGKNVLSIGKSSTASDVAVDALRTAASVTQVYKQASICMPKYLNEIPYEFFYYKLEELKNNYQILPSLERSSKISEDLLGFLGNPGKILPEWEISEEFLKSNFVNMYVLGEDYQKAVFNKEIRCIQGEVSHFYEKGVVLNDGRLVEAEVVLVSTGYNSDYSFLSEDILKIIQFDKSSRLLATVLFRSVFHPQLPRFCFVGNYVFGVLARYEMEAELGFSFMMGNLLISSDEIDQGIRDEEYIRTFRGLKQPYDHFSYVRDLARILRIDVDFAWIQEELKFGKGIFLPQFFFLERPGVKDAAREVVERIRKRYPMLGY
jgi:hypothetical protein